MTDDHDIIAVEYYAASPAELRQACTKMAQKKTLDISWRRRIPVGASVEVNLNVNEVLGDEYDDIVLNGICVDKVENGYRILFSELPANPLFTYQPKNNKPRIKPKKKAANPSPAVWLRKNWHKHQSTILGASALAMFLICGSIFFKSKQSSKMTLSLPPAWQQVYDSGNVTVYPDFEYPAKTSSLINKGGTAL